jgi:hypothetical protein
MGIDAGRRKVMGALLALVLVIAIGAAVWSGSDDGDQDDRDAGTEDTGGGGDADVAEPELRTELLVMKDADQAERLGEATGNSDRERTERLREILDEHGWPTHDLVGEDGSTAAWVIAQHSDLDVDFQREAFDLMEAAVADDQADASELAYLEDRIAANTGRPQRYGTQIGCVDGEPTPGTPLAEPDRVDELREDVGLAPLDDYYAELEEACAAEAAGMP